MIHIVMKKGNAIHAATVYTDKNNVTYLIRQCGGQFLSDSPKMKLTDEKVTCKKCLRRK